MILENVFHSDVHNREIVPMDERSFPYVCIHTELDRYADGTIPWHWHTAFEIEYLAQGRMELHTPERVLMLEQGDAVFLNSGVLHQVKAVGEEPCTLYAQIFDMHFLTGMYHSVFEEKYVLPVMRSASFQVWRVRPTDLRGIQTIQPVLQAIQAARSEHEGYEFDLRTQLSVFWRLMLGQTREELSSGPMKNAADLDRIKTMMDFVQANCKEHLTLEDIAQSASISVRECTRCFRRCIDLSPIEYVVQCRVRLAARLLLETGKSMLEISEESGFSSASYFGKVFRQSMGCTPKEYRKANGQIMIE